ncbi:MAG TPA: class I SAM-dependent methyltransferase [Anaeromyxobacter sp.]|nr:class I SAM-dependent methyltransferase [Anaeromyxobacter sp.]
MDRDHALSEAFDQQAARFERSRVQSDPELLARLVAFAALPAGARVLDAGCGPGLVAEALLAAGLAVHGVDLSGEMIRRAEARCARFGGRARFEQGALRDAAAGPFDAAISRLVLHHADDPAAFLAAQAARVRPGGAIVACDVTTDPDPTAARWHQEIERARDRTHARNLAPGELVDLLAGLGLAGLELAEAPIELDFDEWFDRGTPSRPKEEVRRLVLDGRARGFEPILREDGGITLRLALALARGVRRAGEGGEAVPRG